MCVLMMCEKEKGIHDDSFVYKLRMEREENVF
jgi:hypothetical protein